VVQVYATLQATTLTGSARSLSAAHAPPVFAAAPHPFSPTTQPCRADCCYSVMQAFEGVGTHTEGAEPQNWGSCRCRFGGSQLGLG
jgi:hypothetical protein